MICLTTMYYKYYKKNRAMFDKVIRWSDDGEYFVVTQPKLMETEVL